MHVGIIVQGPRADILVSNRAAQELLGLSEEQLFRITAFDLTWNAIHEDGSPFQRSTHPVQQATATKQPVRGVVMGVYRPTSEDRIWLSVDAEPEFDAAGDINQVICTFSDITALKQSEANLRQKTALLEAQLNATLDGILIVDDEGQEVLQNKRLTELFKIPPQAAENGDNQQQLQHVARLTKDPQLFLQKVTHLYNHPVETSRDEVELTDGTVFGRYSAPIMGQNGENFGRIWTFRDITKRK
jgi:PAS domain S-box-containing protein